MSLSLFLVRRSPWHASVSNTLFFLSSVLFVTLPLSLCPCLSVCLRLSMSLSVSLCVSPSLSFSFHYSLLLSVRMFCLWVCLSVCLSLSLPLSKLSLSLSRTFCNIASPSPIPPQFFGPTFRLLSFPFSLITLSSQSVSILFDSPPACTWGLELFVPGQRLRLTDCCDVAFRFGRTIMSHSLHCFDSLIKLKLLREHIRLCRTVVKSVSFYGRI